MAPDTRRYDAFISYSHDDETAARRIQNFLERYKLPKDIAPERRVLRVFRDATDIRTGPLSEELNAALDASGSLVVCCSPAATRSEWVAQEIGRFLEHDRSRPVVPVLLQGDAASSIPEQLRSFNHRFADLRSAWLAGRWKSRARDELIRALATIRGVELRQLISWQRRRRRRLFLSWGTAAALMAFAVSLWPVAYHRKLDQLAKIATNQIIEYCDVAGDRLVVAAREKIIKDNQGTVADLEYTTLYADALHAAAKGKYVDETGYAVANRLVHAAQLRSAAKIVGGTDRAAVLIQARKLAQDRYPFVQEDAKALQGVWAAEPRPGLKVLLYAIKPSPEEGADGPPAGNAVVVIAEKDRPLRPMTVDGLYPPEILKSATPRGAALMNGLAIVASGKDLFIGMSIRKDGGLGGLWRWRDGDSTWELQKNIPRSVYSMVADPQKPGRLLLSTAPGRWESAARKGEMPTRFFERADQQSDWREMQFLPVDSRAEVQLCGFVSDGTLYVRNQQALFALGSEPLYRRWF